MSWRLTFRIAGLLTLGIVLYAALLAGSHARAERRASEVTAIGTVHVTYLLDQVETEQLEASLSEDFDVTSSGTVIVRAADRLLELSRRDGNLAIAEIGLKGPAPSSFAVSNGDDTLLTVGGGYLGTLEADGSSIDGVPLPFDDMRVSRATANGTVFLFGGANQNFRLYRFFDDGVFQIVLESTTPIVAATDNAVATYAATADTVMRISSGKADLVFKLPPEMADDPIVSCVAAVEDGLLFVSTRSQVFAVQNGAAVSVINNSGGSLRLRQDGLYVLDYTAVGCCTRRVRSAGRCSRLVGHEEGDDRRGGGACRNRDRTTDARCGRTDRVRRAQSARRCYDLSRRRHECDVFSAAPDGCP